MIDLNILACPKCKLNLIKNEKGMLSCNQCRLFFEIKNNVPILLVDPGKRTDDLMGEDGKTMRNEYENNKIIFKALNLSKKIITSSLPLFNPFKKYNDILFGKNDKRIKVLNIGSGTKRINEKVINLDIDIFKEVDVVGEAELLPFKNNSFESVVIESVLEHVKNPQLVVSEIFRVLKSNGYVFATIPFMIPYHGYPNDYQRYTLPGFIILFKNFKEIKSGPYQGPSVALINFLSEYFTLFSFSKNKIAYFVIKGIFTTIFLPLKLLDLILAKNQKAEGLSSQIYFLGQKIS